MTGPKGNSEFCFPSNFNVPRGEARNVAGDFNGWLTNLPRFQGARPDQWKVQGHGVVAPGAQGVIEF